MQFPSELKRELIDCCEAGFDPGSLQTFSSKYEDEIGINFNNAVAGVGGDFEGLLSAFIDKLKQKDTLVKFIECLRNDPVTGITKRVKSFGASFDSIYDVQGKKVLIKDSFFRKTVIGSALPFVGRQEVASKTRIVVNESNKLMLIDGEEKSGITYLSYYFSEIAREIECSEFVHVELIRIKHEYANGSLIEPKHLAQYFYDKLDITGYNTDAVKFTQFSTRIKEALKNRANYTFFFVDQFQDLLSNEGKTWMKDLARESMVSNYRCYFVIGGKQLLKDWSMEVKQLAKKVTLGHGAFTKLHVELFFRELHQLLSKEYDIDMTEDEFAKKFLATIPESVYQVGINATNVSIIGEQLAQWYSGFLEQIKNAN